MSRNPLKRRQPQPLAVSPQPPVSAPPVKQQPYLWGTDGAAMRACNEAVRIASLHVDPRWRPS
jgi:hypothetical protein